MLSDVVRRVRALRGGEAGPLLDGEALRFFAGYYRPRAARLAFVVLGAAAQSFLVLPVLALVRRAFDVAIPARDAGALVAIGAGVLLLRALGSGVALVQRAAILHIVKGAVTDLRRDLVARLYCLSRAHYDQTDLARLHTRIVQDSERLDQLSDGLFSGVLPAIIASAVLAATLVALDWRLVALTLGVLPLLLAAGRLSGRLVKGRVQRFRLAFETYSRSLQFVIRHLELTRSKAHEGREMTRQHAVLDTLRDTSHRMAMSYAVHAQVQRTIVGLAGVAILVAGGIAVAHGRITVGQLVQFYVAAGLLNASVDTVLVGVPDLIAGSQSLATLRAIMREGDEEPYRGGRPVDFDGRVALERVTFGYGAGDVLREVTLEIPRGASVVVTGVNGAGKSTLLHLLTGGYRPRTGRLLASGVPYEQLDIRSLRRQIGVVPQHPLFFLGTARENVTYGCPEATDAMLAAAASIATADLVVERLPAGWETRIGDGGVLLSGGQCQRLAIARALLGAPRLLVLDEPTTHLDVETVQEVMRRLIDQPGRPTLLTISHDPAVIACADVVYRIDDGRLWRVEGPTPATVPNAVLAEAAAGSTA